MIQAMILSSFLLACAAFLLALARLRRYRGREGHDGVPATGSAPIPSPPPPAAEPPTPSAQVEHATLTPTTPALSAQVQPETLTPITPAPSATGTARATVPEPAATSPMPARPAPGPARLADRSTRNNGFSRFASQPGARAAQPR